MTPPTFDLKCYAGNFKLLDKEMLVIRFALRGLLLLLFL